MADLSTLLYPTAHVIPASVVAAMRENITPENATALGDRLRDAEQAWRYFCRRDEMNAEVHADSGNIANVRYSPITIAAERTCAYLARLYYGPDVELVWSLDYHLHPAGV